MKTSDLSFENPWRPNLEIHASIAWLSATPVALFFQHTSKLPPEPFYWMASIAVVMSAVRIPQALALRKLQKNLKGKPLEKITIKALKRKAKKKKAAVWLGDGYVWENRHAQRVHEILKRDWSSIVKYTTANAASDRVGQTWIHGVEPDEAALYQSLQHGEMHTLIVGTTGCGKTRFFDLLITQAILRGECVIILDPKGDRGLYENAARACRAAGKENDFVFFHPAFPHRSVRIDPLANFTRVTELASRVAALMPTEGDASSFKAFAWQAINNLCQAMVMVDERPNLVKLKSFLDLGTQGIIIRAVSAYAEKHIPRGAELVQDYIAEAGHRASDSKVAAAMVQLYTNEIRTVAPSPELEAILSMFQHDKTHFAKTVANLGPIMNMLTTESMTQLLSPTYDASNLDEREITDTKTVINNGRVLYVGLDQLTDQVVGSAVGSILLSDLCAVAGNRYNYGVNNRPVNIFIDEASELINEPTISLLARGRGALMKLVIATQTIADFETRLGSKEKARQVLGNVNNLYVMRTIDTESQTFVCDNLPKTRIKSVIRDQGFSSNSDSPLRFSAKTGERLMEEEADLFNPQLLGMLPNLEYIAKISGGMIIKGRLPILEDRS